MTEVQDAFRHPDRLKICAFLSPLDEADFQSVKAFVQISDALMSKHLKALEAVEYIRVMKRKHDGRQRTWIALTRSGRKALNQHLDYLRGLIDLAGG